MSSASSASSAGAASVLGSCLGSSGGAVACASSVRGQNTCTPEHGAHMDSLVSGTSSFSSSSSSSFATFFPLPFLPFLGFAFVGPNSASSRSSGSISAGFFGALMSPFALAASVSDPSPGAGPWAKDTSTSFFFLPFFFWDALIVDCMQGCRASTVR